MTQHIMLTMMAVLIISVGVSGKRGCSAFGHSCFGGHGKRSSDNNFKDPSKVQYMAHRQLGQEETPPHPVYTEFGYGSLPGDDIIPIRDGGAYDREDNIREAYNANMKIRNIIKYWIDNYRRSRVNNDDGNIIDTL